MSPLRDRLALAALLIAAAFDAAAAETLPRLFFTPEERRQIEAARAAQQAPSAQSPASAGDEPRVRYRIDGAVVARSRPVAGWVDGMRLDAGGRRRELDARVVERAIRFRIGDKVLDAPVGTEIDLRTRQIARPVAVSPSGAAPGSR
jgi:hypothetical protein